MNPTSLHRPATAFLILALVPACSALHVYEEPSGNACPKELAGIPFFRKVGALQQTTTRLRTYRAVTLTVLEDANETDAAGNVKLSTRPIDSLRLNVTNASWNEIVVKAVISNVSATPPNLVQVVADLVNIGKLVAIPSDKLDELFDVSRLPTAGATPYVIDDVQDNTVADVPTVDYGKTYFVNAITPLFGTANLTAKLAPDGTLTEVTAAVDSTKLADELPISEFLSSKLIPVAAAATVGGRTVQQYRLVVSAVLDGYRYTLTRTQPITSSTSTFAGTKLPPLDYAQAQSITRKRLSDAGGAEPAGKPLLSVSGVVSQLPTDSK